MAGKKIMITLSETKAEQLEKLAKEKGVTKSVFVALAIEEFAKKGESNESK
jgi:predicted DNA-binding protein